MPRYAPESLSVMSSGRIWPAAALGCVVWLHGCGSTGTDTDMTSSTPPGRNEPEARATTTVSTTRPTTTTPTSTPITKSNTTTTIKTSTGTTTIITTTTTTTGYWCPGSDEKEPSKPKGALDRNGVSWKSQCYDVAEAHFFGIGDWGGDAQGHTWSNPGVTRERTKVDEKAAGYVARQMNARARVSKPEFVLNAGDNFYPGGVEHTCGSPDASSDPDPSGQFAGIFQTPFGGKHLKGKPWFSVLGNHDYGGIGHMNGWDLQIFHTWTAADVDSWRMPGQYWHQHVKYRGFAMDFFMLDSNWMDAKPEGEDPKHNICNGGGECYGISGASCAGQFAGLWSEQMDWLEAKLKKSTAEWKIIVTHFPGEAIAAQPRIQSLHQEYGIDLLFTGHRHCQEFGTKHGIPYVVSGAGGGVTSDCGPDDYGFVDFAVNSKTLTIEFYSWGGEDGGATEAVKTHVLRRKPNLTNKSSSLAQTLMV